MMDKYKETKEVLNSMADVKMKMNSHKGNIENLTVEEILGLLDREVKELRSAVRGDYKMIDVMEEAADVQNYLVALVHQQIEDYRGRHEVK